MSQKKIEPRILIEVWGDKEQNQINVKMTDHETMRIIHAVLPKEFAQNFQNAFEVAMVGTFGPPTGYFH